MRSSAEPKSALGIDAVSATAEIGKNQGMVLRIERSSVHDGDGFRTVVFLKGCPLRCQWCSTPESLSAAVERTATNTYGTVMTVEQVMAEVRKDSIFFFHSGGGLTLSGGEPLAQADFAAHLLRSAQYEGINTVIETSLAVPFAQVEKALPYLDTMYADLKHIDPEKHRIYCGMDNAGILNNMRQIDANADGIKFIVRMPLVPGVNDDAETLHRAGVFLASLKNLKGVQLLPYHRLGTDTYRKLGRPYLLESVMPQTQAEMEACREIVRSHIGNVF